MTCSKANCGDLCKCGHCSGQHESYELGCDVCECEQYEEQRLLPDIHIQILGVKPQPKGRPRFANGRAYTPKTTRDYEKLLAWHFRLARSDPLIGPLSVELTFTTKSKADVDNLIKACLDAGNGTLWRDDSQVRSVHGEKVKSDEEKIQVVVKRRAK